MCLSGTRGAHNLTVKPHPYPLFINELIHHVARILAWPQKEHLKKDARFPVTRMEPPCAPPIVPFHVLPNGIGFTGDNLSDGMTPGEALRHAEFNDVWLCSCILTPSKKVENEKGLVN